jgi:hypothetical protein
MWLSCVVLPQALVVEMGGRFAFPHLRSEISTPVVGHRFFVLS